MTEKTLEGTPIIISAPSGSGKTTLTSWLLDQKRGRMEFSISVTTRPAREGEVEGKDYLFWRPEAFRRAAERGEFLEWAEVHEYLYGTPKEPTLSHLHQGRDVLFDIDVQGARSLSAALPRAISIFILPPSYEELCSRLRNRGTESEERIRIRLENAAAEILCYHEFDFVVINDDLQESRQRLLEIVGATRCLKGRMAPRIEEIIATFDRKP